LSNRLEEVYQDDVRVSRYEYDENGNRLRKITPNGTVNGIYDDQDRLLSHGNTTYGYTNHGDLEEKIDASGSTQYTYDVMSNLSKVVLATGANIEYVIDGRNRCIGKKVNGQLVQGFLYQDALNPVAELDGDGNVVARFVYGTRGNVPDYMTKNGQIYRIVTDQLGSPRLVVDIATGTVAQRMRYDAFGVVIEDTRPGFQPFGFAGGIYDRDTGLVRFGTRGYDAVTGRWTAKDPILFDGGGTNFYVCVGGDS